MARACTQIYYKVLLTSTSFITCGFYSPSMPAIAIVYEFQDYKSMWKFENKIGCWNTYHPVYKYRYRYTFTYSDQLENFNQLARTTTKCSIKQLKINRSFCCEFCYFFRNFYSFFFFNCLHYYYLPPYEFKYFFYV